MITGDCPYDDCDHVHMVAIPSRRLPCWGRYDCEACGREYWMFMTRVDPRAFTKPEFHKHFRVTDSGVQPISDDGRSFIESFNRTDAAVLAALKGMEQTP